MTAGRVDAGAISSACRRYVAALVLEHYPGMTERAIARIAEQAEARWPLTACTIIHRTAASCPVNPSRW